MAVLARKRFLAGVSANVALQQPRSREGFAAEMAFAGKCVRPDVHLEGAQAGVLFFAELADEGLFSLVTLSVRTMELLVLGQTGISGIRLTAVGALVAWCTAWHLFTVFLGAGR